MKILTWVALVVLLLLVGYVAWERVAQSNVQTKPSGVSFEVSAESAAVYEQRVVELEARAAELKQRMTAIGAVERPEVKARLAGFEQQITDLKRAIAQWRVARGGDAPDQAYRQCILLYGKASGVCDALASDTLGVQPKK